MTGSEFSSTAHQMIDLLLACTQNMELQGNAGVDGGAVSMGSDSSATFDSVIFQDNLAHRGSAIYLHKNAEVSAIVNCTFLNNTQVGVEADLFDAADPVRDFKVTSIQRYMQLRCGTSLTLSITVDKLTLSISVFLDTTV